LATATPLPRTTDYRLLFRSPHFTLETKDNPPAFAN
jgi:hypothetical protein